VIWKIYLQSVWGKTHYWYFKHQKYQNLGMNNKVNGDKNAIRFYFLISAEYLQKI